MHLAIPFISIPPSYLYRSSPTSRQLLLLLPPTPPSSARLHLPNPRRRPPVKPSSLVVYAAVKGRHVVARDRREKEQKEGDRTSVNDQSQSTAILALYSCPPPSAPSSKPRRRRSSHGVSTTPISHSFHPITDSIRYVKTPSLPYRQTPITLPHTANTYTPVTEDTTLSLPTYQASLPS